MTNTADRLGQLHPVRRQHATPDHLGQRLADHRGDPDRAARPSTRRPPSTTYDCVGDTLAYSYLLTNTGNVTLAGPFTVSDDRTTVSCPADTSLAPGDSITCSATETVDQADLDAGFVTNTATGHAAFTFYGDLAPTPVDSNDDSTTVAATQTPALSIDKSSTRPRTYDGVGDILSYSYLVPTPATSPWPGRSR